MSDFDPTQRGFVSYIDKSREFYLAKGYGNPYRWASNPDAPFTPLTKPLAESRVALVTHRGPGCARRAEAQPVCRIHPTCPRGALHPSSVVAQNGHPYRRYRNLPAGPPRK